MRCEFIHRLRHGLILGVLVVLLDTEVGEESDVGTDANSYMYVDVGVDEDVDVHTDEYFDPN